MTAPAQLPVPSERALRGVGRTPPGAARLLAELAVRGLRDEDLPVAAMLVIELEAQAHKA